MKKIAYILIAVAVVGWIAFRFASIGSENSRQIFNATRVSAQQGKPSMLMNVRRKTDVLKEPLFIKANRAFVSGARVHKFSAGQKIGEGKITYVSPEIDLDSGMHLIKTKGAADGLGYAEYAMSGFFVPVYAITDGHLMVSDGGVARKRAVEVKAQDSEFALVSKGLADGDLVVLSKLDEGDKIKVASFKE
ncbi:MAG: hypothetical protein LBD50_02100 [Rickettsiales bacterium]|jgi:multidrug efflux pump subunit AcrA (membrane-fusion protein)|nr:hypothetical protein [Rickettsiales bacterium]